MQVTVDKVLCVGSGNCEMIAPHIFEMGEDAKSHVRVARVPEDQKKIVNEAVKQCPAMAISIQE